MSDNPQVIFQVGVNQQLAQDAVNRVNGIRNSFREARMAAREMREVGLTLAGMGAALIAPFAAAAQNYANRFKGLTAEANRYNAALAAQARANENLGRVAATVLTPQLEKVAKITERIADFAAAHPDLINAGLNLGAVLVAGGGAIAAVGHAQRTLSDISRLMSSGGIGGTLMKSIVAVGALAAGAKLAEVGLNKLGEATGNSYLEHFKLADALKTVRTIIAGVAIEIAKSFIEAKMSVGRLGDVVIGIGALVTAKFESIVDSIATGIRKFLILLEGVTDGIRDGFVKMINGLIESVNSTFHTNIGRLATTEYQPGQSPSERIAAEDQGFTGRETGRNAGLKVIGDMLAKNEADRQKQYAIDQDNLKKIADFATNFANTGSLGPIVDKVLGGIGEAVGKFLGGGGTSATGTKQNVDPDAVRAFIDRNKKIRDLDRQTADERQRLLKEYEKNELKAREKLNEETEKSNEKYDEETLKAQQAFDVQQTREFQNYTRERTRKERDLRETLQGLAAAGDVAGFVEAQKQGQKDLDRQKEDFETADKQRKEDFARQERERQQQHDKELHELQMTYDREERERQQAYREQLQQLNEKHEQEREAIDRAFAEQLADLQSNLGNLNAMQQAYYEQQSAAMLDFVNRNMAYLQGLTGYTVSIPQQQANADSFSTSMNSFGDTVFSSNSGGGRISRFASSLFRVPYDKFPAYLDKDETVLNKQQADAWRSGTGGIHVTLHQNVGELVTPSQLQQVHEMTIAGVKAALIQEAGQG